MDIAGRVYNHNFKIDPIVRTLLDTDFYKLLMQQMILDLHPNTKVKFSLINRTKSVPLAKIVSEQELREQLDYARTLRFTNSELIWLAGNTFYGQDQMFMPKYIDWLRNFQLPEYDLRVVDDQFVLDFEGDWASVSAWEIPALSIMNELRARSAMRGMSRFEIDVLYARAKAKLWNKVERIRFLQWQVGDDAVKISDFGTRRRHGFLWQRWAIEALMEGIGSSFTGTSNVKHAMDVGVEAIGTNAHELPMVYTALANTDEEMISAQYQVLSDWSDFYGERLQVILPDAYGTTGFLRRAPEFVSKWKGIRPDSKHPVEGVNEYIEWLKLKGENPMEKIAILSDGMDIEAIERCVKLFHDKIGATPIGWGTNLTNDFAGCSPIDNDADFKSMSLVCKVTEVEGRPAVKLSDNPTKATGPKDEVARYLRLFGTDGMVEHAVTV